MPELPEVESMRAAWDRCVAGAVLAAPDTVDARLLDPAVAASLCGRAGPAARRGKVLLLPIGDQVLRLHPRMTGRLLTEGAPGRACRLGWDLGSRRVRFDDPRRLGTAEVLPARADPTAGLDLGPEPWPTPLSGPDFAARFAGARGPIKPLLLEGARVAGIGNIGASEALFDAGIHPATPAGTLGPTAWTALGRGVWRWVSRTLAAHGGGDLTLLHAGGDNPFQVYGRAGAPCPRCGAPILTAALGGRNTWFCGTCQPPAPA